MSNKPVYKPRKKFDKNNIFDLHSLVKFLEPYIKAAKDDRTIVKALTEEYRGSALLSVISKAETIIYN